MDLSRTALMAVDLQNGFVTPSSAAAVTPSVNLIRRWVATEGAGPVVLTRYWNYPESPYERLVGWHALYGPPETDLVDDLAPYIRQAHVLDKTVYSALTSDALDFLQEHGISDLVVCGIATDACVLKTVLDAFELGFTPWVVRDAVASNASKLPAQQVHDSALLLMSRLVGAKQLIYSKDVLAILSACSAQS